MLNWLTLSVGVGAGFTDPADYAPDSVPAQLRIGAVNPTAGAGAELLASVYAGETRSTPYPFVADDLRLCFTYDAVNGQRADVPVRVGFGYRTLLIDDEVRVEGYPLERQLGLRGVTGDVTLVLGSGLRVYLGGPFGLRVDLDLATHIGDLPTWLPPHSFWELTPSVAIDVRAPPVLDRDHDHVPDEVDACASTPEDTDGYADTDGCPELDNDADRVPDAYDDCPNDTEDLDEFQDHDGCPESNNDHDRYPDTLDGCPSQIETENGWQDGDGCPDVLPADLEAVAQTHLDRGSGPFSPGETSTLTLVDRALSANPSARLLVVVHVGGEEQRTSLSPEAEEVRVLHDWFVARGLGERVGVWGASSAGLPGRSRWSATPFPGRWVEFRLADPVNPDGSPAPLPQPPPAGAP